MRPLILMPVAPVSVKALPQQFWKKPGVILAAYGQSMCWMATGDYADLPGSGKHQCRGLDDSKIDHISNDDYFVISHSLGSRIVIDGMQRIAHILANTAIYGDESRGVVVTEKTIVAFQNKRIPIFMLSNQLPMLQLGRKMSLIAFSYLANPLEAHVGYDQDDRVIALIFHGIGNQKTAPLIKQRCKFTKTVK